MEDKRHTVGGEAFTGFPYSLMVVDGEGRIVHRNDAATSLFAELGTQPVTCCDLLGCRRRGPLEADCLTQLAKREDGALPEIRVDLEGPVPRAAWVTAARLRNDGSLVVHQMRPGDAGDRRRRTDPHWMAKPQLRINTFGRTEILSREGPISGTWLDGRAGQLLKYMLVERDRVVRTDEIVENVWRGSDGGGASSVRFYIHELRRHLEPDRAPRAASFLVWKRGGYQFDLDRVQIDANDFERDVNYGLRAFRAGNLEEATTELEAGLDLYHGDFLADEAYADWVLVERDRLRSLAVEALEAIAEAYLRHGTTQSAIGPLTRLAEFQPFDSEMQRKLLCALLADGRRTDAMRRYEIFRRRLKREFGEEPEFALGDLAVSQRS